MSYTLRKFVGDALYNVNTHEICNNNILRTGKCKPYPIIITLTCYISHCCTLIACSSFLERYIHTTLSLSYTPSGITQHMYVRSETFLEKVTCTLILCTCVPAAWNTFPEVTHYSLMIHKWTPPYVIIVHLPVETLWITRIVCMYRLSDAVLTFSGTQYCAVLYSGNSRQLQVRTIKMCKHPFTAGIIVTYLHKFN